MLEFSIQFQNFYCKKQWRHEFLAKFLPSRLSLELISAIFSDIATTLQRGYINRKIAELVKGKLIRYIYGSRN